MDNIFWILLALNGVSFLLYGLDKRKAIHNQWRIPEKTLLGFSLLGPIGGLMGMRFFHHKTRKPLFQVGVPLFVVVQTVLLILLFKGV
ncbi:MAG: DUF1294 domain-containing protein [Erysipelotrichaceae bacterium]